MDGRGGCCIARYVPGAHDVNKIMLRFRPIAPKPVAGATASDGSSSESSDAFFQGGRTKRKYVRDNNNNNSKRRTRRKNNTSSPEQRQAVPLVTLPLLPETPDPKDSQAAKEVKTVITTTTTDNNNNKVNTSRNVPVWLSFENRNPAKVEVEQYWYSGAVDQAAVRLGGWYSCVTVECVTDTWVEGEGLGSTDEERRGKLRKDTCPGFISDGYGRVTWQNGAYREMMGEGERGPVLLVMKVGAVVLPYASFTCRVRVVQYACGKEKSSLTVPCDVWRMDSGGFAWRLDVKAALSLRLLGC